MPQKQGDAVGAGASLYEQAQAAFYRDLPQLLQSYLGRWVAYHGDEFIGSGATQTELFQRCVRRGLSAEEFVVLFADRAALTDQEEVDLPWQP